MSESIVQQGLIERYREWLPITPDGPVISLGEGSTPLVHAPTLSEAVDGDVWIKVEGANPTGSFKDRGMTVAVSVAAAEGAKAVVCASTGNTSASAAAYAVRAGMTPVVLLPAGKIAKGKLAQSIVYGAKIVQIDGNFDDCLLVARKLEEHYPIALVNSVNPNRIEGQKTGSFEIIDALGDAPDVHLLPVGNAGNITAYWKGYKEYFEAGKATRKPKMWGFQAAGAAPLVLGHPVSEPETIATAIRIGNPASAEFAIAARDESGGLINSVTDEEILAAQALLASQEGIFVEPASASGVAGLLKLKAAGQVPSGLRFAITVTGNGLKDIDTALLGRDIETEIVSADVYQVAAACGLN
ncbi:threonine synthase [Actinomycetaceae bacterium WB03_NA08]|uniref:Threonine synthase n=1 Tax=Scrofimicrobium canadense TaxID=2652290 RepID=A0A6N7W5W1_9ACTO|nr:threonine synthase [Scrofimicrobium canadense]MSS83883.1 threonine synthase [Scrofimicrobium canadense]